MKVIDPGHHYALELLDYGENAVTAIRFVKREGPNYPGNRGAMPGTTLQEALRACRDRIVYLNRQKWHWINPVCRFLVGLSIWLLEYRAARRHGRFPVGWKRAIEGPLCWKCLHAGCGGRCR